MFQSAKELYNKMLEIPDLCGNFELIDNTIYWNLFDGYEIQISIDPRDNYFGIDKKSFGKINDPVTHWHPDEEEVFREICDIGLKGNVLVIRKNLLFTSVVYMGKEENCPYSPEKKWSWGKICYLKAK